MEPFERLIAEDIANSSNTLYKPLLIITIMDKSSLVAMIAPNIP